MLYFAELIGKNKKKYRVELLTDADATEHQELRLMAGGLVVRIDGAADLFTPLRGGSASIAIRTNEMLPFYTTDPMGVSATIYEDGDLLFFGYVTPSVYSSMWAPRATELTIECRDALSVLADLEFDSESDIDSFGGLLNKALAKVGNGKLTLDLFEPFDTSLYNLSVIRANWFDEGNEASKWSDVLTAVLQWCNCRLTQWRGKWYVNDFRHLRDTAELDKLKCEAHPTFSLTEVHQKNKLEVSLYEEDESIIDAFADWKEEGAEEYYNEYFNSEVGEPVSDKGSFLLHYSSPNIAQKMYNPWALDASVAIDRSGEAMAKQVGTWLVNRANNFGADAKKYIVVTTPHQDVPWRDRLLQGDGKPYNCVAFTLTDSQRRVFRSSQSLLISGTALMSTIPAPLLSGRTEGKYYNAENGRLVDYEREKPARIYVKVRVDDKLKWVDQYGIDLGWHTEAPSENATSLIDITFGGYDEKNQFQKDIRLNGTPSTNIIGGEGFRIPLADGLEGRVSIDFYLYTGRDVTESLWISDFKVAIGYFMRYFDKFVYENSEKSDLVYENDTEDDPFSTPYEVVLNVSTPTQKYSYSRSAVYENTSGANKPVGELMSVVSGEMAIAEHHLLDAITVQNQAPRLVFNGTWRNHVASPTTAYHSANLDKTFIVESLEVDCDASTSTMKLEEIINE